MKTYIYHSKIRIITQGCYFWIDSGLNQEFTTGRITRIGKKGRRPGTGAGLMVKISVEHTRSAASRYGPTEAVDEPLLPGWSLCAVVTVSMAMIPRLSLPVVVT